MSLNTNKIFYNLKFFEYISLVITENIFIISKTEIILMKIKDKKPLQFLIIFKSFCILQNKL